MLFLCLHVLLITGLAQAPSPMSAGQVAQDTNTCAETPTLEGEPPKDPEASPFGYGAYHVNDDRSIWLAKRRWFAGKADKGIWIRPRGTKLEVTGRRLDGDAPALKVSIPCCYPSGFQVTGMTFPTEGCWEVRAKAGDKQLRFVVIVEPAQNAPSNER